MRYPKELEFSRISGAGGGGSAGKTHVAVEAPNTLRSVVKGRILDLIAFGPIKGLRNGLKSVYLDGTPVENADGTKNFDGITLVTRYGDQDQTYIEGFTSVENSIEIGTEVLFDNPPVRSVSNNDADAVLITVQLAALVQALENGDSVGYQLPLAIDVRSGAGSWNTVLSDTISGKTTSPYPITYRISLSGTGPFDIRVRRLNKESQTQKIQDKLTWTILNEVIDERLSYPNMALVGITVDSQLFGSTMPSRSYDMDLSIVDVPSNYDPETRVYTGLWNGTFKKAWTDNPAWCYYDLATHPVIGAGLQNVDKWVIYRIGQYCDELVEDGYGGMEPRFTCNTMFAEQEDAISALNTFASAFRGMAYWGTNTMMAVADMPMPVVKIASPSNVIDGEFEYVGTSIRERHSVCVVMWNDPNDQDKAVPEIYEDPLSIDMYGWKETRVTAVACSSRGQAMRLAKWILYSERMETQTVQYKASLDHADVRPGDIIELADPDYQGARMSGRVMAYESRKVTLDQAPTEALQSTTGVWYLSIIMPDGTVPRVEVTSFVGNVANLLTVLPADPVPGAVWALSSTDLELPQFRVVSVVESNNSEYSITATEYDPRKYDIVEKDLVLPERPTSMLPSGPITPPMDLSFEAYKYFAGDSEHQGLVISWTPPKDARVDSYILDVMPPDGGGGFQTVYTGSGLSFDMKDIIGGQWTIRVRSIASAAAGGIPSSWTSRIVQIAMLLMPTPPDSITVTPGTFSMTLTPFSAYPNAIYEFWRSEVPLTIDLIESNATQLPTGQYLVDTPLRSGTRYYYYVRGVNQYGKSTWVPAQGLTLVDFDDILQAVTDDVVNGDLYQIINGQIETVATETAAEIATDTATTVVNAALEGIQDQIDNLQDALVYKPAEPYTEGNVVRSGKNLWQAVVNVPANPSGANGPPNPLYWKNVGDILEEVNGLALQVQQNTTDIQTVDGKVTATASQLTRLQAKAREDNGEGDAQDALAGYNAQAGFTQQVKVLANADMALSQRLTSFEAELDDNSAQLATLEQTMVTADQALSQQLTTLTTDYQDNKATVSGQIQAVSTESAATAQSLNTLTTDYQGNKTTVQNQITAVSDAQAATAQSLSTLNTDYQGNKTTVQNQITAVSDAQAATAQSLSTLNTDYQGNKTTVQNQITAVSSAQAATAQSLTTLNTDYQGNKTTVQNQITAVSNQSSATAGQVATLQTTVNGNTSAIQVVQNSQVTLEGKLTAQYAIKLALTQDGRTYAAGMGLDITTSGGVTQSQILFQANRIAMINTDSGNVSLPFLMEAGTVYINNAMFKNASIDFLKISDTMQSDNYSATNKTGWRFSKAGTLQIYANGAKGSSEFTGGDILMRDTNGTLRIKMSVN